MEISGAGKAGNVILKWLKHVLIVVAYYFIKAIYEVYSKIGEKSTIISRLCKKPNDLLEGHTIKNLKTPYHTGLKC